MIWISYWDPMILWPFSISGFTNLLQFGREVVAEHRKTEEMNQRKKKIFISDQAIVFRRERIQSDMRFIR